MLTTYSTFLFIYVTKIRVKISDDTMDQTRKKEAQFSMARIEKHFTDLKEQLYKDRIAQVEKKIEEVKKGTETSSRFRSYHILINWS